MGAWFILFFFCGLMLYCFWVLFRVAYPAKEKIQYSSGPAPTKEQRLKTRHFIAEFIEEYPSTGLAKEYPDLAHQAALLKQYKQLEEDYEAGKIEEIDYLIQLDKLAAQVDIDELEERPPFLIPLRLF